MSRYSRDPYQLKAKYAGKCANEKCGAAIKPGDKIVFYPIGKHTLCPTCGDAAMRELAAHDFDERGY